ncbi:MAG: PKD domain-containing protein, partial [Thermoplasmata archaeon]|nr:PKD domain-containing protein [Thermoplasmata archaeon]
RADTIRLGDILTTLDGDVVVTSIERITQAQKVYNIEVENNHNYFAEGILVHNVLKPEEPYCPFVYTWNGAEYVDDNNILPASTDPERSELDVTDYYRLTNCLVPKDGNYTLLLLENRTEMVYFDQLELMVIDHPEDHEVAMTSEGELVTFSDPISPIFCEDTFGNDVLYQIIGDGDGQYFEGTGGDHLTLTFENMDDITEAKLVVRQKMLPPPEPYDQITAYDPMKCSIHVQTFDESGEWIDLGLIPGRMNWAMSAVSLASVIDYIKNGGEIRLSITGEHLIDFVGLDISEPQPMDVNVYSPIYANYQQSEEVNLVSRLLQKDQWYMAVTSGQDIQVTFPYEPLTDECRDIVLVTTGHYYTASLMTIAQTVKITASVDGGDSGKVTLWLAEEVDRHTTSKVLGQTLNLQEGPENDIRLEFRQIPEMHYSLIAEFENCTDEVTVLVELVSSHGSEILKFDYTPTGSQYDEQSYPLDETFWKITGVSFDPFSGRLLALKNTTLQFSLSEFYLRIENWTDALWDFGDGLSTVEMLPSHEYSSPGTYLLNLTLHNETLNATLITWTKIDIVVSPPEPVLDIYQEVDMTLRVTGRKGNTVTLQIYEDGTLISEIAVARTPGPPNTHTACIHKYLGRDYTIMLIYDAPSGDENPTWLTFNSGDNKEIFFIEFDSNNGIHQEVMVDPELLETVVQGNRQFYFDASGSYDIDGEIVSYDWEFGDDCIETGELVEHTFADAETYTVTLTGTDDDGAVATIAREVVVS